MTAKSTAPPPATDPDDLEPTAAPRQVDLLDVLTIAEIDAGSRELGGSLVAQVATRGDRYEKALAVVLWLHERRRDRTLEPKALLRELSELRFSELQSRLTALSLELAEADPSDPLDREPS